VASAGIGFATGFWQIIALRVLLGIGEAIAPVASIAYIKRNFTEQEQGLPTGIYIGGALIGPAVGSFAGGALLDPIGWRMLFVVTGVLGCLWLIPWWIWAPVESGTAAARDRGERVPWLRAAGTPVFRAVTLGAFFYSYYWYFILTWVPAYLVTERGFSNFRMGATLGLPLAGTALTSLLTGAVADRLIRRSGAALGVRKAFVACGFLFGAAILLLNVLPSTDAILPVFLLSMCGVGFGVSNYWALIPLVSPARLIGRIIGYQNTVAQLAGITAPIVTGLIVGADKRFELAIVAAGLSPLIAASAILLWMRAEHIEGFQKLLNSPGSRGQTGRFARSDR
jgi:MFS family permease